MLSWVAAEEATLADVDLLAPIYAPRLTLAPDLKAALLTASRGSIRHVSTNLANVASIAAMKGIAKMGMAEWGTRAFLLAFGGADFYIAKDPKGVSKAVDVIGIDGLRALGEIRDRLQSRVPTGKNWIARYLFVVEGKSKAKIARTLHASTVSVNRWLNEQGRRRFDDPRQQAFFEGF